MIGIGLRSYTEARGEAQLLLKEAIAAGNFAPLFPSAADESWRKVDVNLLPFDALSPTFREGGTISQARDLSGDGSDGRSGHFRFEATGTERDALLARLADLSLGRSDEQAPRPDDPRDTSESFFRKNLFTATNLAFAQPLALSIPKVAAAGAARGREAIIEIDHSNENGASTFPAAIISVEPGADVTIIERHRASGTFQSPLLHAGHTVVIAGAGSKVRFVQLREHGPMDFHFHHVRFLVHRDASVHSSVIHSGGIIGKGFVQASVLESGASYRGTGLFGGTGGQTHHIEMGVQHLADHGTSSLLYKTVLAGRSHSVFLGNLEIPKGISKVDSHQLNHNLILTKRARAESRPWLVIRSEDVKCEHGATVGDLDAEAIFFLKSRGFPEAEARRLLIQAFLEEVIAELPLSEESKDGYRTSLMSAMTEEGITR